MIPQYSLERIASVCRRQSFLLRSRKLQIFCMEDYFCKFFDAMKEKYTLPEPVRRQHTTDNETQEQREGVS